MEILEQPSNEPFSINDYCIQCGTKFKILDSEIIFQLGYNGYDCTICNKFNPLQLSNDHRYRLFILRKNKNEDKKKPSFKENFRSKKEKIIKSFYSKL